MKKTTLVIACITMLSLLVVPGYASYQDVILSDNPLGYWRLNESTAPENSEAVNLGSLGTGYNGVYCGGVTAGVAGALESDPVSTAIYVDNTAYTGSPNTGLTPRVNITRSGPLTSNNSTFSIEVWAKATGGAGTYRGVIGDKQSGGTEGFAIYASGSNKWEFYLGNGLTGGAGIVSGPAVTLDEWVYLVAVVDGSSHSMAFYVNGELAGTKELDATLYTAPPSETVLRVGAAYGNATATPLFHFIGDIDEVAYYGTSLTVEQVAAHYSASIPEPSLLAIFGVGTIVSLLRRRR